MRGYPPPPKQYFDHELWPDDYTIDEMHSLIPLEPLSKLYGDWPELNGRLLVCDRCGENEATNEIRHGAGLLKMYNVPEWGLTICDTCRCEILAAAGMPLNPDQYP